MKSRIFVILILLIGAFAIGVSAFDGFPSSLWNAIGKNTERQASNLKAHNMNARDLAPIWIYPRMDAGLMWTKTLDDADVTVTNGIQSWTNAGADTDPIRATNLNDIRGSKFVWAKAINDYSVSDSEISKVKYEFKNLKKGDYQVNLSVPSKITITDDKEYIICNQVRVTVQINSAMPAPTNVNLNKEEYSGRWIYASNATWHVDDDNSIVTVTVTNFGKYNLTNNMDENVGISQIPIVIADAVRLVKTSDAKTVGSPVSARALEGTIIKDDTQTSYNDQEWMPMVSGSYNLLPGEISYNNRILFAVSGGVASYELTPIISGEYKISVNLPKLADASLNQAASQDFRLMDGGTELGAFTVPTGGGWQQFGAGNFTLEAGRTYVLENTTTGVVCVLDAVKIEPVSTIQLGLPILFTALNEYVGNDTGFKDIMDYTGKFAAVDASGDDGNNVGKDLWFYPGSDIDSWEPLEGPVADGFSTSPLLLHMKDYDGNGEMMAAFVGDKNGIFYAFDASGSNKALAGKSRLLFKGPGIFKSEPLHAPNGWSQTAVTRTAFGSKYLVSNDPNADKVVFDISESDRYSAGDGDVINNSGKIIDTYFRYKIKLWIPSDAPFDGQMRVDVDYSSPSSFDLVHKDYTITIDQSDLGTWKDIDVTDTFNRVTRVTVNPVYGDAVIDNIWLAPALPSGENYAFGDVSPVADILIAPDGTALYDLQKPTKVFAITADGRVWAFDITSLFDINNKTGKLAYAYPNLEDRVYWNNEIGEPVVVQPTWNNGWLYIAGRTSPLDKAWDFRRFNDERSFHPSFNNSSGVDVIKFYDVSPPPAQGEEAIARFMGGGISQIRDKINTNLTYFWVSNSERNLDQFTLDLNTNAITYTGNPHLIDNAASGYNPTDDHMATYTRSIPTILSVLFPDPSNPANNEKVVVPDAGGSIYSFDAVFKDHVKGYPKAGTREIYSSVIGSILKAGNLDNGQPLTYDRPQGYVGLSSGYMKAFSLSTVGNKKTLDDLNTLLAGVPGDENRRVVTSLAQIINGADKGGNSLVNINGADGYNWAYSDKVYGGDFQGEKPFADDWEEYTDESIEEVDPSDVSDARADLQVDLLDYKTAKVMMRLLNDKDKDFSAASLDLFKYSSLKPADNKTAVDSWSSDTNIKENIISKKMRVIPEDAWNFIMTGSPTTPTEDTVLSGNERYYRYRLYMLKEALKARKAIDVDGNKIDDEDGRILFWNDDKGGAGERQDDPKTGFPRMRLEWGDKIYLAMWNAKSDLDIKSRSIVFIHGDNVIRRMQGTVATIWDASYPVLRETAGGYELIKDSKGNALTNKVVLMEITFNISKIQSFVGFDSRLYVELSPDSGESYRIPVPSLEKSSKLMDFEPYLSESGDWILPKFRGNRDDLRESFGFNNPIGIKINKKPIGLSYDRFDTSDESNYGNGMPIGKTIADYQIDLGKLHHGNMVAFGGSDGIAQIANRSMMDILNGVKYYSTNHNPEVGSFYSNPFPWEYGLGSLDYPAMSPNSSNALDEDNEDLSKRPKSLTLADDMRWDVDADDPYTRDGDRKGEVKDNNLYKIRYQIDVPVYQPAMKKYVANAAVYIDVNANRKFDKTGDLATPNVNDEPHRAFQIVFSIEPDANVTVDADYIDFGNAGHGVGYPLALNGIYFPFFGEKKLMGIQSGVNYNFNTRKPEIARWFKPFKVKNEGNVNIYDLVVEKQPLFANLMDPSMSMAAEGVTKSDNYDGNWANALRIHENNIVSSLDYDSKSIKDSSTSNSTALLHPFSSNPKALYNDLGSGTTYTLSKSRVGDTEESLLTIPDVRKVKGKEFRFSGGNDYNRAMSGEFIMDVRDIAEPKIGIQIPVGMPMGHYSTKFPVKVSGRYQLGTTTEYVRSKDGINLDVNVKEAQVTGTPYDRKSGLASLYHVGEDYIGGNRDYYSFDSFNDATPMAFQKHDGSVGLTWSSNSYALANLMTGYATDNLKSLAPANISIGMLKNEESVENEVRSISDGNRYYDRTNWWRSGNVVLGDNGWPDNLLVDMSNEGLQVPVWTPGTIVPIKQAMQFNPSHYSPDGNTSWLTFAGRAEVADSTGKLIPSLFESRIFYINATDFVGGANTASGEIKSLTNLDAITEKKYPVMTSFDGDKKWFFWQSSKGGKSSISFTTEDFTTESGDALSTKFFDNNTLDGFSLENKVRLPDAISSAGKPNAMPFTDSDGKRKMDLVYTGINTITGRTDVYLTRYNAMFNDNGISGFTENAVPLPRVFEEMTKDTKFDFYMSKGLAWLRQNKNGDVPKEDLPAVVIGLDWNNSGGEYNRYIDIFTGLDTGFTVADWDSGNVNNLPLFKDLAPNSGSLYPKFSFDTATNVMTIEYEPTSMASEELGKTLIDFSSGVIRFTKLKEREEFASSQEDGTTIIYNKPATVYASYVPQTLNLTLGDGINDGGYAFWDEDYQVMTVMWRKTSAGTGNGIYYKVLGLVSDPNVTNRSGFGVKIDERKVPTDGNEAGINENSISGFLDNRTGGSYGKLWIFWAGTKSGTSSIYYATDALKLKYP